jgi:hypothetical protein
MKGCPSPHGLGFPLPSSLWSRFTWGQSHLRLWKFTRTANPATHLQWDRFGHDHFCSGNRRISFGWKGVKGEDPVGPSRGKIHLDRTFTRVVRHCDLTRLSLRRWKQILKQHAQPSEMDWRHLAHRAMNFPSSQGAFARLVHLILGDIQRIRHHRSNLRNFSQSWAVPWRCLQ